MKNWEFEKKVSCWISVIWAFLSLLGGIFFIKKYYDVGMSNQYCLQIGRNGQIFWASIAYLVAIILIFGFSSFVIKAIFHNGKERMIILFSIPFLIILTGYLLTDVAWGNMGNYYVGDEKNIWDAAVRLYPFFFVYTSEIFLTCFFIIPVTLAPSIVKIIFCSLVMGYVVYRTKKQYNSKLVYALYLLCCLEPVCEQAIRVHRMQWYAFIYLFYAVKLYFDSIEKESKFSYVTIAVMSCLSALLTALRREGLYLFLFGAILMGLVYAKEKGALCKKRMITVMLFFFIAEFAIYFPVVQNGFGEKGTTYGAYFVHMLGEKSLDRDEISDELEIANQYMDIEIIDKYNNDWGTEGYADCMYAWPEWSDGNYYALRNDATVSADEFAKAVFRIIKKEPIVFAKSRVIAFAYAARSTDSYNLFMPLLLLLFITGFALVKREKTLLILCLGILLHTGITILTMPASYFKYFYAMYLFSYFFIAIILIRILSNGKAEKSDEDHLST